MLFNCIFTIVLIAVTLAAMYSNYCVYKALKLEVAALEKELECLLGSD